MAKTVFPIHLGPTEHRILEAIRDRDGCSKAEAARRIIRSYRIDIVAPPATSHDPISVTSSDNAH